MNNGCCAVLGHFPTRFAWGFDETDPDALDGESFSLSVAFSDGGAITASGSNRFPEGYADAAARIEAFFQKLMESYEIDVEQIIL